MPRSASIVVGSEDPRCFQVRATLPVGPKVAKRIIQACARPPGRFRGEPLSTAQSRLLGRRHSAFPRCYIRVPDAIMPLFGITTIPSRT
jgi:hypothetical protein